MIVKLRKDANDVAGIFKNRFYKIISLSVVDNLNSMFRIISDDGTPALYNAKLFNIIDNKLDSGFSAYLREDGAWEICPSEISSENFWIEFFDGDSNAVKCYYEIIRIYSIS